MEFSNSGNPFCTILFDMNSMRISWTSSVLSTYHAFGIHKEGTEASIRMNFLLDKRCSVLMSLAIVVVLGCDNQPSTASSASVTQASSSQSNIPPTAPAPGSTGGFDGARAYEHVRHLVEIGPRPPDSNEIRAAQAYIIGQLKGFGCQVEEHDFHGSTPIGEIPMKNIVAKIPGSSPGIVLYATHYDTLRMPNFVGADDGGSGTGTMLELARLLCSRKNVLNVWIAFFDGEEAQGRWPDKNSVQWLATNSTFGSREMAASMALSGELKRVKAMILADMIGPPNPKIKRDTNSTQWLNDLIWATAARLGYDKAFLNENYSVGGDDHFSFLQRGVAATDIIDFTVEPTYWHTPQDTLEKIDPRSLAIVGHVFVEALPELERKFH
jgi:glutaminyl-peptide cyclotransferase